MITQNTDKNNDLKMFNITKDIQENWTKVEKKLLLRSLKYKSPISLWWLIDHRGLFYDIQKIIYEISNENKKSIKKFTNNNNMFKNIYIFKIYIKLFRYYYIFYHYLVLVYIAIGGYLRKLIYHLIGYNHRIKNSKLLVIVPSSHYNNNYNNLWRDFINKIGRYQSFEITNYLDHTGINIYKMIKQMSGNNNYFPLELYLNCNMIFDIILDSRRMIFNFLSYEDELLNIFRYKGLNISNYIYPKLIKYVFTHLPFYYYYCYLFKKYIKTSTISLVMMEDGSGFYGRSVNSIFKPFNIKTIDMQHGDIRLGHPTYSNVSNIYANNNNYLNTLLCPRPDYYFVFNYDYMNLLVKKLYIPSESVYLIGNPYYDFLLKIKPYNSIMKKYNRKWLKNINNFTVICIVLRTNGKYYTKQDDLYILKNIYAILDKIKYKTLIKLHPLEKKNLHKKVLSKIKNKNNFIIIKNLDLLSCYKVSDIVIGSHSTAFIDSIYSKKLTISYDPFNLNILTKYTNNNLIARAKNTIELESYINDFSKNGHLAKIQKVAQEKYFKSNNPYLEGMSSLRIIEIINGFLSNGSINHQ